MNSSLITGLCLLIIIIEAVCFNIYVRTIKTRYLNVLGTLICVMEAGDPNLDGHSMHVYNIVSVFYDYLPSQYQHEIRLEYLKYAALLHDIGKLGIPRDIITKRGKLTMEELSLIRRHPEICVNILKSHEFLSGISDWILYHHERVDGKGYHNISGKDIPLASRILAIADTYSALTMDRTYKATMPYEEAIVELRQVAGTQLDRELIGYFCEIPKHRLDECLSIVHKMTDSYKKETMVK
jgi:HD-GYP domain-containing protein (c-di-GMP phosphodiesterase class II)